MSWKSFHVCWALLAACHAARAADPSDSSPHHGDLAVVGATIHVGNGPVVTDGVLVLRAGKVERVGPRSEIGIPDDVRVIHADGKHVTAGFVDLHSTLFIHNRDLRDYSNTRSRSVVDALDVWDPRASLVEAEGVTTVAISPGTSRGAGGLGAVVKLRPPPLADEEGGDLSARVLSRESHYAARLGVSHGTSTSAERLEQYYGLRRLFLGARKYEKSWDTYWKAVEAYNEEVTQYEAEAEKNDGKEKSAAAEAGRAAASADDGDSPPGKGDPAGNETQKEPAKKEPAKKEPAETSPKRPRRPKAPALDIGREALLRAMHGDLPFLVEAHRRDDIEYGLQLKKEFGLELAILGGTQAYSLPERVRRARTTVAVAPVLLDRRALEYKAHVETNAAQLAAADVPVAICSVGKDPMAARHLRLQAVVAVRGGLSRGDALRAITLVPARVLGLDGRIGSLEPGKDGDFVILSGEPLDALSRVEAVAVDGRLRTIPPPEPRPRGTPQVADGVASEDVRDEPPPADDGEEPTVVFRGARVVTPRGDGIQTLERGTIVVRGGRIQEVGNAASVTLPEDAKVIDVDGKWILPGFLDAHSHIGIAGETDDIALAISEDLRVLDAFDPWDPEIPRFLEHGITAAAISPGRFNVVGGKVSVVKLVPERPRIRVVDPSVALKTSLAPRFGLPRFPTAVSGAVRALQSWVEGDSYRGNGLVLLEAPSRASALRALDLFGAKGGSVALVGGRWHSAETWAVWRPKQPVILGPYSLSDPPFVLRSAAILQSSGTPVLFATDGTRRDLLTSAVLAIRAGLDRDEALAALTARPAALYGLADRLGSIRPGADADLVVWNRDPFSLTGCVERVFIDGEQVFLRETPPALKRKPRSRI